MKSKHSQSNEQNTKPAYPRFFFGLRNAILLSIPLWGIFIYLLLKLLN
jgi:hypothetical protein